MRSRPTRNGVPDPALARSADECRRFLAEAVSDVHVRGMWQAGGFSLLLGLALYGDVGAFFGLPASLPYVLLASGLGLLGGYLARGAVLTGRALRILEEHLTDEGSRALLVDVAEGRTAVPDLAGLPVLLEVRNQQGKWGTGFRGDDTGR